MSTEPTPSPASETRAAEERPRAGDSRFVRWLFFVLWVFAAPFGLGLGAVWLLTPEPGGGPAGPLRVFVSEQQIPAGIVLFTLFAMVIWRFRHDLPLAQAAGIGGRRDVPASARNRFEDAGALLDEAQRILKARKRDVERELTPAERDRVTDALAALDTAMWSERFDAKTFDGAYMKADRAVFEHLSRWRKGEMREYAESIGIAVAVALILRAFVVEAFKIPSGSMIPTLMVGDHIFVNKFAYGPLVPWTSSRLFSRLPPSRADVMVFKFPENLEQDFIKRTIAVPGDTLEAINGRPVLNGWLVPHCRVGTFRHDGHLSELFVEFLEDESYFTLFDSNPDDDVCSQTEDCAPGLSCKAGLCGLVQGPFKAAEGEAWVMGDNRNNSHDSRSWRGGLGGGVPFENIKGRAMFVWMSFGPGGGIAQDRLFVNVMGRPQLPPGQDPALTSALEKCLRERPTVSETTPPSARK